MRKSLAFMNWGRWLYPCLECGTLLPADKDICPICNPDMSAILLQQVGPKQFRPVPDIDKRNQARARAEARGELYEPEFPKNKAQIERVLRKRARQHMNWEPGESLGLLIADNIKHGDPLPKEMNHGL